MSNIPESKRAAILYAALELFAESGFHSAPMSRLASLADVGVGSIYRYFADKDELIHAVYEQVDDALQRDIIKSLDSTLSPRSQFIQLVANLIYYLKAHSREFKFLEQYYNSPYGIEKKRVKFSPEAFVDQSNPIVSFYANNVDGALKGMLFQLYLALTFGPIILLVRDSLSGLVVLDEALIQQTSEACWSAIKA
ncbi:MAG: TetR/AcrR family transcriptional regulator [Thermodesulfobacteriota bacterium]|nr:TetR/AcrR family transcriptional regulator [Thermodesulfobacteriota bacterium]